MNSSILYAIFLISQAMWLIIGFYYQNQYYKIIDKLPWLLLILCSIFNISIITPYFIKGS